MAVKRITQETFDDAVKENMDDFGSSREDAIKDTMEEFEMQVGVFAGQEPRHGRVIDVGAWASVKMLGKWESVWLARSAVLRVGATVLPLSRLISSTPEINLTRPHTPLEPPGY